MAIYHCSKSEVQRSKGHNAVAAGSYISRSKLQLITTDSNTGEKRTISYNFTSRKGLAHSIILAPDDAPSWVYNRQELWNKAESAETRKNSETARKLIIALPKELTLQQNIELIEQFALECLVSHGMVADINIHYDNEDNPHVHIQMTTRKLIRSLENDQVIFGEKGRDWGRKKFLYYYRENVAHFINLYLEKYGHLEQVSHLSHKARGIGLIPTIHEGAAHYIKDSKLRLINEQILQENAVKIRANPELVFDKLSINKPVFTREEIAIALSDALTIDIELGQTDKQGFQQHLREISKQLVAEDLLTENVKEDTVQDLTILADGNSKQDSEVANTSTGEDSNNTGSIAVDHTNHNSTGLSNIELLNQAYSTEFMHLYSNLLVSDKISLINPSDLKGRTLYALTKRVKLEQRFITTVEELQHSQNHNLFIDDRAIGSMKDKLIGNIQKVGMAVQEVVNNKIGLQIELIKEQNHSLTEEQRKAIIDIVCGKDISVLEGYPGAGKTFVMREIVRQYQKAGYRVIGTAQSSSATKVLESSTGIESKNTTLWRKEWQEARGHEFELPLRANYYAEKEYQYPDRVESNFSQQENVSTELDNKTVFIIDEASMIELANMDYLLTQVLKSGAKVIIVGDNNQLSAVGMAGAFKKICSIVDASKLTAVMRHKHPDECTRSLQREATKLMGLYKIEEALEIYQELEIFNIYENEKTTKEALVANYVSEYLVQAKNLARDDLVSIRSIVIGAYTNVSVNYFNIEVRERLKQAGILKGLGGNFKSGHEMVELLRGEQIVFVSNKAEYKGFYGVLNGELATVIDFTAPDKFGHGYVHLLVHKADGSKKIVNIDTADSLYPVRFKHGYAVTGYKLQGETVDYMKVYYESTIGYEAFNVLMSRYRYEVNLYAAQDVLKDIVYKRVEEDAEKGRARFSVEGYRMEGKGKERRKQPVPSWYIGLIIGVSKRVNNNLAINYRKFDKLSPNEQVIKNYLEFRQVVFDLHGKMQEWQERQERPIKLAGLYGRLTTTANVEMENAREITINPYGLMLSRSAQKEIKSSKLASSKEFKKVELPKTPINKNSEKILWSKLSREKQNELIWNHLSKYDRQILKAIYTELEETKEELQQWAKIICDNYHGSVKDKAIENSDVKDQVSMGDRIIQLDLNYQTIQKHAGYSGDKYSFEKINQGATLIANNHWRKMMGICYSLRTQNITVPNILNSQDIVDTSDTNTDWLNIFTTNLANLHEFINETKLSLTEKTELLHKTDIEHQEIKKELKEVINYREQLFPEFLSRIYKTPTSEILQKWQNLLVECQYEQLSDAISKVKQNPNLLGSLRGIGFGTVLGISQRRKDAISNFEVIAKRFRNYEQGAIKAQELQDKLTAGNYQKLLARLSEEITLLTDSLPNKYEHSFLDQLDLLQKDGKLNIENLAEIVKTDELRGLIYEYYRYINNANNNAKLAESIKPTDIQGENQQEITSLLPIKTDKTKTIEGKVKTETNENKTNKYNRVNTTRNNRLDFNEVKQSLTEYNYRNIFESYARRINGDNVRFKKTSAEISLGSLTMNLRTGLWIRHSTGEGGNIFSFVQKALCCSKLEALERVALTAGISAKENNYYNDNKRNNNKQPQESKGHEEVITKPINEWYAQPYVPDYAPKFDPKIHLAGLLKSNTVDDIYYYRNNQKQLIGLTVRLINRQDGKKQVLPVSYCRNESLNQEAWKLKGFSDNGYKPIYHIDKIKDKQKTILIVEGEKTCDKAQELLPDYIVLSWLGGSNGAAKANWQQLTGREIVIWADNDQAGITAARTIGHMINEANGRIGNVTIIDPSRLEFNGTINENILPEKWDLADRLPAGLNIDNLKEAIINGQQQNISLHNSQSIAAGLQQLLPQSQELAIGERILWQARSVGTLLTREQIIQEATTEFNWQEKLTSPEAKYYMKYAETTGKDGSKHEFLGLQDGIYRDTLVAIAKNGKIKDIESLKLPELIHELQSEYEQKQRINQVGAYHSFGDDEHYQFYIKSLESYGSDRIELYHIMVRDVSLLHQEQLTGLRARIIKAQQKAIEQKIYEQIKTYQVKQARGQTSNKLDYDDKVKIASKIYDNLCSSKLWQSLAVQDITYVQKLQQELQPEVQQEAQGTKKQELNDLPQPIPIKSPKTKNNNYEERIEKIVEKYNGQNHDPELINKWTEELAELKTYNAGSLSNIVKIGERKGLEQALQEIVSINADKNKELRVLFEVYKDRIDEIQKFNDKLTIEELKHTIKPLKYNDMIKAVEKMRVDSFRDWIIPQFNKIEKERQETQEVEGLLNSLEQERELSLKIAKEYQSLTYNVSEEMKGESINDKSRVYDSQPDLLENIKIDSLYIAKYNIWEEELLIKELKRNTSELKDRVASLMFKFSQLHCKKQVAQDIKAIEEQGILIKDNKQFKTVQGYLDDLMNNKEIRPYIRGTDLDGMTKNHENHGKYIKSVFTKYQSKIETIVKLQPKYNIEQLKDKMKLEDEKGVINLLGSEWLKAFKDYVTPRRAVINKEREEAKSVSEVLQLLKKEKDFCLDMYKQYKEVVDYYSKKEQDHYFLMIAKLHKDQPELLSNLARDINNVSRFKIGGIYTGDSIETDDKLVEKIKDATQVGMLAKQLYKACQAHVLKEISPEIKELNSHGVVKINDNTYDEIDYLKYRMNDKLLAPYLKNTTVEKRLTEIYRQQQHLEQQKQL